ncbi:DNA-binding MurR/RpiR family transcriptional regulator [Parapusillimonas granuli]|uniref:MurR/RpiR family transcriptional regulator n=2 Tax=Parapusillimonas granuli TaxID=380911 RepID=A0A853FXF3_9BURK|nr:MurR/RpiR family transcriptional regulator [Parapusillimonas granuli]MBB5214813.1 DNA-binding MurR/RpiR family transcriptional regulator [Parapusillimonas granuli]MEB2397939.1 MurR/RpiR family transcriptional regulator [Alcaligenaceae bacterium]NYT48779.1 MurR/RpiR family transcriptional regulator [Parapusillimonas granuli]
MAASPNDPQQRLQAVFAELTPELQRAARWVSRHPAEVGLWSMRRQAQALSVSPATMLRLARAAGYPSYDSFRAPFQQALTTGGDSLRQKAAKLQAAGPRNNRFAHDALSELQSGAVQSVRALNTPAQFDAAAQTMLGARLVGFLGSRSSFGTAFQMRYAYQLVQRNGVLLDGCGSTLHEQADLLGAGDALVVVSQSPYATQTIRAARDIAARGAAVIALTDDALSPLALNARHVLLFRTEGGQVGSGRKGPGSFFHTMAGPLALAEHLVARCAVAGGKEILNRLDEVELRMRDELTYGSPPAKRG